MDTREYDKKLLEELLLKREKLMMELGDKDPNEMPKSWKDDFTSNSWSVLTVRDRVNRG